MLRWRRYLLGSANMSWSYHNVVLLEKSSRGVLLEIKLLDGFSEMVCRVLLLRVISRALAASLGSGTAVHVVILK